MSDNVVDFKSKKKIKSPENTISWGEFEVAPNIIDWQAFIDGFDNIQTTLKPLTKLVKYDLDGYDWSKFNKEIVLVKEEQRYGMYYYDVLVSIYFYQGMWYLDREFNPKFTVNKLIPLWMFLATLHESVKPGQPIEDLVAQINEFYHPKKVE